MSLSVPRTKLIADMKALGYNQIQDAFDFQNVGNTRLEKAFHIEQGRISAISHDQQTVTFSNIQTIRFWEKGKKKTSDLMGDSLTSTDTILAAIMAIANRVDGVSKIDLVEIQFVPHSSDNDDIVRGELVLDIEQICAF